MRSYGDSLKNKERHDSVEPAAILLRSSFADCSANQDGEKDVDGKDVADADVHASRHGEGHIDCGRYCHVEDFAPLRKPARQQSPTRVIAKRIRKVRVDLMTMATGK